MCLEFQGTKMNIEVYEYDTPIQLALKFCKQNNWDIVLI